jgi:hypothetical protein
VEITTKSTDFTNLYKLLLKSNIQTIFRIDIYRFVGDIAGFETVRKPVVHSRNKHSQE